MHIFLGLIVIGFGMFGLVSPELAWHLSEGWKFKDVEPSDAAIEMTRVGGLVGILFGIGIMLFAG